MKYATEIEFDCEDFENPFFTFYYIDNNDYEGSEKVQVRPKFLKIITSSHACLKEFIEANAYRIGVNLSSIEVDSKLSNILRECETYLDLCRHEIKEIQCIKKSAQNLKDSNGYTYLKDELGYNKQTATSFFKGQRRTWILCTGNPVFKIY